ncbi:MAG: hypothetical protein HQK76_09450 [Desulfobacterales bacterium]|nr:hypothetical protein [Desulfobacterales bacterium]
MPLLLEQAAIDAVGFPSSHWGCFKDVAIMEKSVIISRAVGETCTLLIEEGYAMKSFRIHGKSCNWGAMAGFVIRDPRLSKKGLAGEEKNREEHLNALYDNNNQGWTSDIAPVKISKKRLLWLIKNNEKYHLGIDFCKQGKIVVDKKSFAYHELICQKGGVFIALTLIEEIQDLWSVYIDHNRCNFVQESEVSIYFDSNKRYEILMGMTNPYPEYSKPSEIHKNVVTGDYDLFAVWPTVSAYEHHGMDRRVVGRGGMNTKIDKHTTTILEHEHVKIGNISDRVFQVSQMINSLIGVKTGLPNRNVCFHSDECGRPMVDEIDAPLIAFVPTKTGVKTYGIPEADKNESFATLVALCIKEGFKVTLHPAWANAIKQVHLVPVWNEPRISPADRKSGKYDWYFNH